MNIPHLDFCKHRHLRRVAAARFPATAVGRADVVTFPVADTDFTDLLRRFDRFFHAQGSRAVFHSQSLAESTEQSTLFTDSFCAATGTAFPGSTADSMFSASAPADGIAGTGVPRKACRRNTDRFRFNFETVFFEVHSSDRRPAAVDTTAVRTASGRFTSALCQSD